MTTTTIWRGNRRACSSSIAMRCACGFLSLLMLWAGLPFVVCLCPRRDNEKSCCSAAKQSSVRRYAHVYCCCCERVQEFPDRSADRAIGAACQFAKNTTITALPPILATFAVDLCAEGALLLPTPKDIASSWYCAGVIDFDSGPPPIDVVLAYSRLVI